MSDLIKKIVIVGGGTSGWMSASYLKKSYPEIEITVVEAPSVPRMGVGEATLPNLQSVFWDFLGIPEEQWVRRVNASFKMGIKFVDWARNPEPGRDDYYYHIFGVMPSCQGIPLSLYWAQRKLEGIEERFDYSCYGGAKIADLKASPRKLNGERVSYYAWHFDANLMAEYLKELCLDWGIKLIAEHVDTGKTDENGFITEVNTQEGSAISGDLFIDCTGFRANLIDKVMKEPFIDMSDHLLCDSAVATQLPFDNEKNGVASVTIATAMKAGWRWQIPLMGRHGTGYVHSSKFTSMDEAVQELADDLNLDPGKYNWNKIRFNVGRRKRAWVKNCVAIGLASNFLEPLESTALYLTYGSLYQLARFFPDKNCDERLAEQFNAEVNYSYDDCRDFVQMHYAMTQRNDTAFWRANQSELTLNDSYHEKIRMYKAGLPINAIQTDSSSYYSNFELEYRNFWTTGNYYAILTGMGVAPDSIYPKLRHNKMAIQEANEMIERIGYEGDELVQTLPSHYEFLKAIHNPTEYDIQLAK